MAILTFVSPARAWNYVEHRALTCTAVQSVCERLSMAEIAHAKRPPSAEKSETQRRIGIAKGLLCSAHCGLPGLPGRVTNMFPHRVPDECALVAEATHCPFGFADAVALIDYKNDAAALRRLACGEIESLKHDKPNEAWQALTADEHFHPDVVVGFEEAFEVARSRAYRARWLDPKSCQDTFRRALFNAARAMHLLEDAYASGHAATQLQDDRDPKITTVVHDRYNAEGLKLGARGAEPDLGEGSAGIWFAKGDGHLGDEDNRANRRRVEEAVETALCALVNDYVGVPETACPFMPRPAKLLVPEPMDAPESPVQLGGVLWELASTTLIVERQEVLRPSSVGRLAIGVTHPLGRHLSLRGAGYVEWYWRRGFSEGEYQQGATEWGWGDRLARGAGGRVGLELSTAPWKRTLRATVHTDAYLGWSRGMSSLGSTQLLDGGEVGLGGEILAYYLSLRLTPFYGVRRSAIGEGAWSHWVGVSMAVHWPRTDLL